MTITAVRVETCVDSQHRDFEIDGHDDQLLLDEAFDEELYDFLDGFDVDNDSGGSFVQQVKDAINTVLDEGGQVDLVLSLGDHTDMTIFVRSEGI